MIYLLDTNVISEHRKAAPDRGLQAWLAEMTPDDLRLSVITLGEIRRGIRKLELRNDHRQAEVYERWFDETRRQFADRIVAVDVAAAESWGHHVAARPTPTADALIGATAQTNGWTLVTRNAKDFEHTGVQLLNPFTT